MPACLAPLPADLGLPVVHAALSVSSVHAAPAAPKPHLTSGTCPTRMRTANLAFLYLIPNLDLHHHGLPARRRLKKIHPNSMRSFWHCLRTMPLCYTLKKYFGRRRQPQHSAIKSKMPDAYFVTPPRTCTRPSHCTHHW